MSTLQEWCDSCEAVLSCVETQINRANAEKNRRLKHKEAIEQEVNMCTGKSRHCVAPKLCYD